MVFAVYLTYLIVFCLASSMLEKDPSPGFTAFDGTVEGLEGLSRVTLWDVATNLVLFLPYGFLFMTQGFVSARPVWLKLFLVTFSAGLISGAIEFAQIWLARHPSVADIVFNMLGALSGGFARAAYSQIHPRLGEPARRFHLQTASAVPVLMYGLVLCTLFAFPLPLAEDFDSWNSEFELYLGNAGGVNSLWQGEIYLIALYSRVLNNLEVRTNFSAGHVRGSMLPRTHEGQLLHYDFFADPEDPHRASVGSSTPVALHILDETRVRSLKPNGLAVLGTTVHLFARPTITPTGGQFSAHTRFSVEAWIAPSGEDWGTFRLVWYSNNIAPTALRFADWKREVESPLKNTIADLIRSNEAALPTKHVTSASPQHVVITYNDGAETSYVNGVQLGTTMRRFRNASIDTLTDFLGQQFKWPLYSALIFPMGYMTSICIRKHEPVSRVRKWSSLAAVVSFPVFLEGIRFVTLNAPAETPFVVLGVGTSLLSTLLIGQRGHRLGVA
ncbi:VanZ family protein [Nitrospira sp. Nam80]